MKSAFLAILFTFSVQAAAQPSSTISGMVLNSTGAPISKATVAVHWNLPLTEGPYAPKSMDAIVNPDKQGHYSISVAPGFYDVCVHAPLFSPRCTTLKAEEAQTARYDVRLKVNRLISAETGTD